jgi:hypothetical protein
MSRDDFTRQTIETLAKRVGVRCSNPGCGKQTAGPRTSPKEAINIGVAAHITAAASGGPRFDEQMSSDERQSIENAIWLCQNCAKLIDNDPTRYTVGALQEWKRLSEAAALAKIQGLPQPVQVTVSIAIEISYRKERINADRHDYLLTIHLVNNGASPIGAYHVDVQMPAMVVHNPENQLLYVRDRSNDEVAFFRVDSARDRRGENIYPGDRQLVMTVQYFMNESTFRAQGRLFGEMVKATCYQNGQPPVSLEKPFQELQMY